MPDARLFSLCIHAFVVHKNNFSVPFSALDVLRRWVCAFISKFVSAFISGL